MSEGGSSHHLSRSLWCHILIFPSVRIPLWTLHPINNGPQTGTYLNVTAWWNEELFSVPLSTLCLCSPPHPHSQTFKPRRPLMCAYLSFDGCTAVNDRIDSPALGSFTYFYFSHSIAHFIFFSMLNASVCVWVCYYRGEREKLVFFKEHPQN